MILRQRKFHNCIIDVKRTEELDEETRINDTKNSTNRTRKKSLWLLSLVPVIPTTTTTAVSTKFNTSKELLWNNWFTELFQLQLEKVLVAFYCQAYRNSIGKKSFED